MEPRLVERHVSPDGLLTFRVLDVGDDLVIGFDACPWHTHPDILALGRVDSDEAVNEFVADVIESRVPLAVSWIDGKIADVWPTDNPASELKYRSAGETIEFRYWDGTPWNAP